MASDDNIMDQYFQKTSSGNQTEQPKTHDLEQIKSDASVPTQDSSNIVSSHYEDKKKAESYYLDDKSGVGKKLSKGVFRASRWVFDSIQVLVITLAVFVVLYLFVVSPHTIDGQSMQPNFCNGDIVLADKLTPKFKPYEVGNVIVFTHSISEDYIKRIVGLPGDRIKIQNGKVYLNGELLDEPYLSLSPGESTTEMTPDGMKNGQEYVVPEGKLWVFGDNRPRSTDSRAFFAIDPNGENQIKGRVKFIIWPLSSARIFSEDSTRAWDYCETHDQLPTN